MKMKSACDVAKGKNAQSGAAGFVTSMRLTKAQKQLIIKMVANDSNMEDVCKALHITGHDAYCSDDFCVAYSLGVEKRKRADNTIPKIGDKVNLLHAGYMIAVAGKPKTSIYTVVKVGRKRIQCINYRGEKGFFAYHDKSQLRTYRIAK